MQNPELLNPENLPSIVRSAITASTQSGEQAAGSSTLEQPAAIMDRLNVRMTEIFGHRWTSQFPRAALDTWAKGLGEMTREQIARGIGNCISGKLDWPPTLPEFRALCLTIPGMPTSDEAWAEAYAMAAGHMHASQCSHVVILHAYRECGDLAHTNEEVGEKRFRHKYAVACRDFAAGKEMAQIPEALPAPGEHSRKELTPEEQVAAEERALAAKAARDEARDAALAKIDAILGKRATA